MKTKKNVFFVAFITTVIIAFLFFIAQIQYCNYRYDGYETSCMRAIGYIERMLKPLSFVLFISPLIFLLSLITYRMKDEMFRAWWGFARWWIPVIIAVTLLLENAGGGGGWGLGSAGFDIFVLSILYIVLVIISLIKIFSAYLKTR